MFFADPISKMNSNQVGDPTEGVLYNLDSPFRDKVVPDKGVMEVSALDNFPIRHIDEDELVEEHFPHDERCTVGHHIGSGMSSYLINIIAVQDFAALDLHFIFDDDSGAVITFADDEIAVGTVGDQSDEAAIGFHLHSLEVVRCVELAVEGCVLLGNADVCFVLSFQEQVVA